MENYLPNNLKVESPNFEVSDNNQVPAVDKSSEKRAKGYILSDESFRALTELGQILRGIHQDMIDEGYEFVDGTIRKKIDKI